MPKAALNKSTSYTVHSFSYSINAVKRGHSEFFCLFSFIAVSLSEGRREDYSGPSLKTAVELDPKGLGSRDLFLMLMQTINVNQDIPLPFPKPQFAPVIILFS